MKPTSLFFQKLTPRQRTHILGAVAACIIAASMFATNMVAYLLVAIPAYVPFFLWMRAGAPGIPVLPAASGLFLAYYALPILRSSIDVYGSDELIQATTAVGCFLIAAAAASWPFLRRSRRTARTSVNFVSDAQIVRLIFWGLGSGIVFHLAVFSGNLDWLGAWSSVLRSVLLTFASVACYILGYARASGFLVGSRWAIAVAALSFLVALSASSLIIFGAAMYVLAALLGYVVTAARVPWIGLGLAFAILSTMHAGKAEMREKYWFAQSQTLQEVSILRVPFLMSEWLAAGVGAVISGEVKTDVFERVSLLHMLLLVQRATPGFIPYLEGETYALLPSMLVPRFLDPEKTQSQAGLNLLSVRYGLQPIEATASTTIAWGLVAEAFANFGFLGVIAIGAVFGAVCGGLMRLSDGAAPNSLPMFITISATVVLLNLDADFSSLVSTLEQSLIAVVMIAPLQKLLGGRSRSARAPRSAPFETDKAVLGEGPSASKSPG